MSFRAPRFCHAHAMRERGIANLSLGTGSAAAGFPLDNVIDDRAGLLFILNAAGALELECDLGAGFETGYDRIIIPAGHNIDQACLVEQADDATFATNLETIGSFTPTAGVQIDELLTDEASTGSDRRYIRLNIVNTGTAWEMSECFISKIVTLTNGPDPLAKSPDDFVFNFERLAYPSGATPTVQQGAAQRAFDLEYRGIQGADLTALEALIADVGMDKPFWVDPVSFSATPATDDPPIWMKFDQPPRSFHESTVPASGTEVKRFVLSLIESLD